MSPNPIGEGTSNKPIIDREEVGLAKKLASDVAHVKMPEWIDLNSEGYLVELREYRLASLIEEAIQQAQLAAVVMILTHGEKYLKQFTGIKAQQAIAGLLVSIRSLEVSASLKDHDDGIRSQEREKILAKYGVESLEELDGIISVMSDLLVGNTEGIRQIEKDVQVVHRWVHKKAAIRGLEDKQ